MMVKVRSKMSCYKIGSIPFSSLYNAILKKKRLPERSRERRFRIAGRRRVFPLDAHANIFAYISCAFTIYAVWHACSALKSWKIFCCKLRKINWRTDDEYCIVTSYMKEYERNKVTISAGKWQRNKG